MHVVLKYQNWASETSVYCKETTRRYIHKPVFVLAALKI
jgi:hypothetical protein